MFDPVFDSARVYRELVQSFSQPGRMGQLGFVKERLAGQLVASQGLAGIGLTLLDSGAGFHWSGQTDSPVKLFLHRLTSAPEFPLGTAPFVFAQGLSGLDQIFGQVRQGTLLDPHEAATVVVEVDKLENGELYQLSGPGIKDKKFVVLPADNGWLRGRARAVAEYPLGPDLVFVDGAGQILALPRTTKIAQGGS